MQPKEGTEAFGGDLAQSEAWGGKSSFRNLGPWPSTLRTLHSCSQIPQGPTTLCTLYLQPSVLVSGSELDQATMGPPLTSSHAALPSRHSASSDPPGLTPPSSFPRSSSILYPTSCKPCSVSPCWSQQRLRHSRSPNTHTHTVTQISRHTITTFTSHRHRHTPHIYFFITQVHWACPKVAILGDRTVSVLSHVSGVCVWWVGTGGEWRGCPGHCTVPCFVPCSEGVGLWLCRSDRTCLGVSGKEVDDGRGGREECVTV